MKFIITSFLFLIVQFQLDAQNVTIKGKITAEDGEALPYANVYVNNSSIGASADLEGNYEFTVDLKGSHKFICSYVGFQTLVISKELGTEEEVLINFQLKEIIASLDQVIVGTKKDKSWKKNLDRFTNHFFGSKEVERNCKIVNPYVLDFDIRDRSVLIASATEPLVIENRFLGYELTVNLESYWAVLNTEQQGYSGYLYFKKLEAETSKEEEKWIANKKEAYYGSINHFLSSLALDSLEENGFQVYLEDKKFDELTLVHMGKLVKPKRSALIGQVGGLLSVQFDGFLRVEYEGRKEPIFFGNETRQINETSWIELKNRKTLFSEDGYFINPLEAILHGAYSLSGIGTAFPIDFSPIGAEPQALEDDQTKFFKNLRIYDSLYASETAYIELEEGSQFVPGASIDFNAFIQANKSGNEPSQVLYLELIGPDCNPILFRKIRIENGFGSGSLILPTTLYSGKYALIAYTSWMKNFDTNFFYTKVIELGQEKEYEATSIKFFPEYGTLIPGQENNLMIRTMDQYGLPASGRVELFDETNNFIAELKTDSMGLGKMDFKVELSTQYFALLNGTSSKWNLPLVEEKDLLFTIVEDGEKVNIELDNKRREDRIIYVSSQSSGVVGYLKKIVLESKEDLVIEIAKERLGRGVGQLSILDENFSVLGSKPIYIEPNEFGLNKISEIDKSSWWTFHLNLNLNDVTPFSWKEISKSKEIFNQFIASHTWWQVDYGAIFNANFKKLEFEKERGITISGKVKVKESNSPMKLDLLVNSETPQFITSQVDKEGAFTFNNVHYTDTTDLIFKYGNLLDTEFELAFDTIEYAYNPANYTFCQKQKSNESFQDYKMLKPSNDVTVLEEVEVSTLRNAESTSPIESYTASKKSFSIENSVVKGNMVARGGVLRYMQTRITGSMLFRDRMSGNVSGILLSRVASYDRSDVALLFYDDVEVIAEVFDAINPELIERIDVLSGTEAASYGFRGSKGVILAYSSKYLNTYNTRVKSIRLQDGYDVE